MLERCMFYFFINVFCFSSFKNDLPFISSCFLITSSPVLIERRRTYWPSSGWTYHLTVFFFNVFWNFPQKSRKMCCYLIPVASLPFHHWHLNQPLFDLANWDVLQALDIGCGHEPTFPVVVFFFTVACWRTNVLK